MESLKTTSSARRMRNQEVCLELWRDRARGMESLKTTSCGMGHFFKLGACRLGGCVAARRQEASVKGEKPVRNHCSAL